MPRTQLHQGDEQERWGPFLKDMFLYFMGNILILKDLDCALFIHSLTLLFSAFVATENSF